MNKNLLFYVGLFLSLRAAVSYIDPTTLNFEAYVLKWRKLTLVQRCFALKYVNSRFAFLGHVERLRACF